MHFRTLVRAVVAAAIVGAALFVLRRLVAGEDFSAPSTSALGLALCSAFVLFCAAMSVVSGGPVRRIAGRAALAIAAAAMLIALLEAPAALGSFDWRFMLSRRDQDFRGHVKPWMNPWNVRDPELMYHRPPDSHIHGNTFGDCVGWLGIASTRRYEFDLQFDHHGYRNPRELETAPVAIVGDSFVEAALVAQERTLAAELGRRLGLDVANLGVGGYGPQQELVVVRRDALRLHPKLVVWVFFEGNDLLDARRFSGSMKYAAAAAVAKPRFFTRSFTASALDALTSVLKPRRERDSETARTSSGRLKIAGPDRDATIYFPYPASSLTPDDEQSLAVVEKLLKEAQAACAEKSADFLLVYVPEKFRIYRELCDFAPDAVRDWKISDLPARMAKLAADASIRFLDLTPALAAAAAKGPLVYFADDGHWNAAGQAVGAEEIEKVARPLLGSPAGTGERR